MKTCSKCGGTNFYPAGKCKQCTNKWAKENPEKRKKIARESRKKIYWKNPEKGRQAAKDWAKKNPDKIKEMGSRYRKNNPDKLRERYRKYREANRDRRRMTQNRRRARKLKSYTEPYDFKAICVHYNNTCLWCLRNDLPLTIDHIIPISKGGNDAPENIQPLCQNCNSKKSNKIIDFRPDKGPLLPRQLSLWDLAK